MVPLDKGLQWVNVKHVIQTNLGTFRYNQTYPGIIQAYLEPCLALTYLKLVFKTFKNLTYYGPEAYPEPRHIHNPAMFRTLAYSISKAYSEPCRTSARKR